MSRSKSRPIIGITMGDPKGIGPEVIQKALRSPKIRQICRPIVFGNPLFFHWKKVASLTPRECGQLSGFYIQQAASAALRNEINAIVTAPICKEHLRSAGTRYPGHTEFLAALAGIRDADREIRMMMAGPRLKVVLVTIHQPFKTISSSLSIPSILRTIEITDRSLKKMFRLRKPRIAVAGLNPHAGEGGMFGDEEKQKIIPAIRIAQGKGIKVSGPYPPDTVFYRAIQPRWGVRGGEPGFSPRLKPKHPAVPVRGEIDVVVAMYHDQGLIPLKLLHFEEGVNITLGLPFIRTSVDHGTAFDIAGKGIADARSMIAAIKMAVELVKQK